MRRGFLAGLAGLAAAAVAFVVVAAPGPRPVRAEEKVGPGDTQNGAFAVFHYELMTSYWTKAAEWRSQAAPAKTACYDAINAAANAYMTRRMQQPPLAQSQIDAYLARIAEATAARTTGDSRCDDAQLSYNTGDWRRINGEYLLIDRYYYHAGQSWYWSHSTGSGDSDDENGYVVDGRGPYPLASLRWAQAIDWYADGVARAAEARAALSP